MQQENLKKRNEIKKAKQTVIGKQMCTRGKYTSFYRKKRCHIAGNDIARYVAEGV